MVAVVLSGFAGRFIYVQIPRTIQGKEIGMRELESESESIQKNIRNNYSLEENLFSSISEYSSPEKYRNLSLGSSLLFVLKDYFKLRSFTSGLRKNLKSAGISVSERKEILVKIKQQLILTRRIGLLRTMQKLFKFWHIVHLPFAITMFVIMFIHIIVTIIFGYRWIF
jgi:hypothetical protein